MNFNEYKPVLEKREDDLIEIFNEINKLGEYLNLNLNN